MYVNPPRFFLLIVAHKLFQPSIVSHLTPTNHWCLDWLIVYINPHFRPHFPTIILVGFWPKCSCKWTKVCTRFCSPWIVRFTPTTLIQWSAFRANSGSIEITDDNDGDAHRLAKRWKLKILVICTKSQDIAYSLRSVLDGKSICFIN